MKLQDLTLKQLLEKTAGSDPVPGGGSMSAMHGATAAALGEMLANLTIGRKRYIEVEEKMKELSRKFSEFRNHFLNDIDRDSDAYALVAQAYKLPKDTDEEKAVRADKIEEATKIAALVPMEIAERGVEMMSLIETVTRDGNTNAITDGLVSLMTCRTSILGAILNVRINLGSIKDEEFRETYAEKCQQIENNAQEKELQILIEIIPTI